MVSCCSVIRLGLRYGPAAKNKRNNFVYEGEKAVGVRKADRERSEKLINDVFKLMFSVLVLL